MVIPEPFLTLLVILGIVVLAYLVLRIFKPGDTAEMIVWACVLLLVVMYLFGRWRGVG